LTNGQNSQLRWRDAVAGLGLAAAGMLAAAVSARMHWVPPIAANVASHAWLAAIALGWYFWLGRQFPVGKFTRRELLPWSVLCLLAVVGNAIQAFLSAPQAADVRALPLLIAEFALLLLVVGPSEELLFRGLVQTGINGSLSAELQWRGWPLRLGTVLAAMAFGLSHLVNLTYQTIAATAEQVLIAFVIGLVIGVVYDRTRNLIGAAVLHGLVDFSGAALPLVAYAVIHR
jgi:membrane protease YdiL (CAAX protease family)